MPNGRVTFNDEESKTRLLKFCEKKIDKWLKSHLDLETPPQAEFHVEFNEEEGSEQISCMTEIRLEGCIWRGCDLADDTQQAFIHSLKRLTPH